MLKAKRGEIWLIDLGLVQKTRPCLIFSIEYLDHERAVFTYIPRTLHPRNTRFEVSHQARGFESGVFDAQGIGGVPAVKLERRIGIVEPTVLEKIEVAVKLWLGLS
jgi:mRNA-degrading endonuclease toxin of MazEF toxin-antitoxin module